MFYIPIFSLGKLGLTLLPNEASPYFWLYLSEVRATDYTTRRPWIYIMSQNAFSPGLRVIEKQVCWTKSDTYILISVSVIVQIMSRPLWGPHKCSEWKDLKCCEVEGDTCRRVCSLRAHRWPPSACGRKILKYTLHSSTSRNSAECFRFAVKTMLF